MHASHIYFHSKLRETRKNSLLNFKSLRVVLFQIYVEGNRREMFNVWEGNFTKKNKEKEKEMW